MTTHIFMKTDIRDYTLALQEHTAFTRNESSKAWMHMNSRGRHTLLIEFNIGENVTQYQITQTKYNRWVVYGGTDEETLEPKAHYFTRLKYAKRVIIRQWNAALYSIWKQQQTDNDLSFVELFYKEETQVWHPIIASQILELCESLDKSNG